MIKIVLLALLMAVPAWSADSKAKTETMRSYIYTKDDSDLFVGEGLAEAKEFEGSAAKAKEAARSRAKAALAESVRAKISSETTEKTELKDGKVSEELKSKTSSIADVVLENIKLKDFDDFPALGQYTVLATVSKEDYRRQMAGKGVRVWKIEKGLRLSGGMRSLPWIQTYRDLVAPLPASMASPSPSWDMTAPAATPFEPSLGLEFLYKGFVLGLDYQSMTVNGWFMVSSGAQPDKAGSYAFTATSLQAGYDWAPFNWRFQPYLPLRFETSWLGYDSVQHMVFGLKVGAGLRMWIIDSLAVDARYSQHIKLRGAIDIPSIQAPNSIAAVGARNLEGGHLEFGIIWAGF